MKNQISSLHQRQTLLKIMIFTLVTAVIWVGLTLFRTQQRTEISQELIKLAEPLNPNINLSVITRIEEKKGYSDQELSDFPIYSIVTDGANGEKIVIFNASDKSKKIILESAETETEAETTTPGSATPEPSPSAQPQEQATPQEPVSSSPPTEQPVTDAPPIPENLEF